MEIVLAILLLFGGITLGSSTTDKCGDDTQSTLVLPNADDTSGSYQINQVTHQSDPTGCHFDGSVIYRDLTVPTHGQIVRPIMEISDCDEDCPDE